MKYTGLNELRESFLRFFEDKGHLRLKSAPLVPQGDNSILLINAGMTPLKKYFQGVKEPPRRRVASCQKCIRTPDIDNVGITERHGTFLEMLGNFSFGDYFKEEACLWAWEYFTKVLEIPAELLWVSVYEQDDEARQIWLDKVGLAPERVVKMGKADNFWEHGSGPCGPCSEIYFDRGESQGCGGSDCKVGCDCDRYMEVWNLVFTQFDNDGNGNYSPLATKNIDTGMGLERLACVMQSADNLFEIDTLRCVTDEIGTICGKSYKEDKKADFSFRVITDHIRSSTFMIGDGVIPSNEGRGYVLRRLLRRAARHGRLLGMTEPFLYELCEKIVSAYGQAYPELIEKRDYIKKTIQTEEDSFSKTVEKGMGILMERIDAAERRGIISGEDAFKLHDTYGFPLDLTKEILRERGLSLDEAKFNELMGLQRDTARANQAFKGGWDNSVGGDLAGLKTEFEGYSATELSTVVLAIVKDGASADNCAVGDEVSVVLAQSPFYAESGGQVGDVGAITDGAENEIAVYDVKKTPSGQTLCLGKVVRGSFTKGGGVFAAVDRERRNAIMRNHTAAHLLQSALRAVLGEQVHQAGSLVDDERCRFDFTHGQALSEAEIERVEKNVNSAILSGYGVTVDEMPLEKAREIGATALFGEKYGDTVRVVSAGEFSVELCGGTHVNNTAQIGLFKISSEMSVAAGVRRIEAVTGYGVLSLLNSANSAVNRAAAALKLSSPANLVKRCETVMSDIKELQREVSRLSSEVASTRALDISEAGEKDGVKLFTLKLPGANADALRQAGDKLKSEKSSFVCVLAGEGNFLCICDKAAVSKGFNAGNIVREIARVTGGKGGGRPDSAMAGIGDTSKTDQALKKLTEILNL